MNSTKKNSRSTPADVETYSPPASIDETISRRAGWTPATRDNGAAAIILTATLATLERAAVLQAHRDALGLGPLDSTITNNPSDESAAA